VDESVSKRLDLATTIFRRDVIWDRCQQAILTDLHDDLLYLG
jgi:hypothetical protein